MPSIWPSPGPQQALQPGSIVYTDTTSYNTIGTVRAPQGVITNMDEVSMKDLQSEAFNTPIDTLIDLWLTRYGNEWVDMDKIEGDEFYVLAYKRLKSLGQLETHYLTDRARFVCRKPT